jgi:FtsZ-binding cell division protein ZapB
MSDVTDRLGLLERQVQHAIDLIESLRAENARLAQERQTLGERVDALTRELGDARQREQALARLETDHRRLLEERQVLLGQVDAILKELARIEGG